MSQTAQIDILINAAQSAKTLGQLDKALSDMNAELKDIPVNSEAFRKLKAEADKTSKAINEINVSGFERKVKGFEAAGKTISSSLSLATGSMALFGSESEEVTKTLARVQGALAISTAFKDFTEAQKAADEAGGKLNKTLLGNPFILIAAVLLPLLLQMDEFKEILNVLSDVFKDIMKALKPLIDAFMVLLKSVLKAIIPIIQTLANILIKALTPILNVVSKVVAGLSPIFERLGEFLSENTIIIDALTLALQATLLPVTLLMDGLTALGIIEEKNSEAVDKTTKSLESVNIEYEKYIGNIENINRANQNRLQQIDDEIALASAQGQSINTIRELQKKKFEEERNQAREILIKNEAILEAGKLTIEQNQELIKQQLELNNTIERSNVAERLFNATNRKADADAAKARREEIKKTQAELQKSYLELRGIGRQISEQLVSEAQVPFVGFFEDLSKVTKETFATIPEGLKPAFADLIDPVKGLNAVLFETETSFGNFTRNVESVSIAVGTTTEKVLQRLFNLIQEAPEGLDVGLASKLLNTLKKQYGIIIKDAMVFDLSLQNTFDDISKTPGFYVDFFSKNLERLTSGFDFTNAPVLLSFELLQKELKEKLAEINGILERDELTIIQRERLVEQRKLLADFLVQYGNSIKSLTDEDISISLLAPIEKTIEKVFEELRTGTNEFSIDFLDKVRQFGRLAGDASDEFIGSVRKSLINLGVEAEKVDRVINKVISKTLLDALKTEEQLVLRQSQNVAIGFQKREELLRRASEIRILILKEEIRRASELEADELKRYIDARSKLLVEGKISIEEFDEDIANKRIELAKSTARVIKIITSDIESETQSESLRRLQRFANTTNEVIGFIQSAAQSAFEVINNLSQQALINLESQFQSTIGVLEATKEAGLLTEREFNFERLKAEKEYEAKRKQIEKANFERQYAAQIFQAVASTALAVINALAQFPGPPATIPLSIAAGALGAAQIAVITSQPKPKFNRGGLVPGGGPGEFDTIDARIAPGEFIVNSRASKRFLPMLESMNQFGQATIGRRETIASPPITDISSEPVRAYVVLDELNEKNEVLSRIQMGNSFFRNS